MTKDIIQFPKIHIRPETLSKEGKRIERRGRKFYLNEIVDRYMEQAIEAFINFGVDTTTEEFNRDMVHMYEGVQALFYRHMGIKHSLHKYLDTGVKEESPNGDIIWTFGNKKKKSNTTTTPIANSDCSIVAIENEIQPR